MPQDPEYCSNGVDDASGYSKVREKPHPSDVLHQDLLRQFGFQKGQRILDFGCGDGTQVSRYLLPLAEKHDFTITGFDISEQMIDLAKKTRANPRIEFVQGDLFSDKNGIVGKTFDGIVSTWVLDYFADYGTVLSRIKKHLKPGGKLVVITGAEEWLCEYYQVLSRHPELSKHLDLPQLPDWAALGKPAAECYRKTLEGLGFTVKDIQTVTIKEEYDNVEGLMGLYLSIISGRAKLSPELSKVMDTVCYDYMTKLVNEPFDGDRTQPVSVNQKVLGFIAQA